MVTAQVITLSFIWIISAVAGFQFLRAAFRERRTQSGSRLRAAAEEVRFRLRLAAGLILLLFVASGLVWLVLNWAGAKTFIH